MSGFKRNPLTSEASWSHLKDLYAKHGTSLNMRQLFNEDKNRFDDYKLVFFLFFFYFNRKKINFFFVASNSKRLATPDGEILFDFSKNLINQEIMHALLKLVIYILYILNFKINI